MNEVLIFYGSQKEYIKRIPVDHTNLTELVMQLDENKMKVEIQGQPKTEEKKLHVVNLVVESSEYAGVREHVILNFANFLNKFEVDNLYLQNPPMQISDQMTRLFPAKIEYQQYRTIDESVIKQINTEFDARIFGQSEAKDNILRVLYPMVLSDRTKPAVLLLYGKSGVGKTETANYIAEVLGEPLFRKQFSMFQNNQFSTYLFGGAHYEKSFAKDLLDRESNIILLDEFDKANPVFHSAFYQLFDEGKYEDQNYYVKLEKSIIVCTSNYTDEAQIKKELGDAIFNRFDAIIRFADLDNDAKLKIASTHFERIASQYKDEKNILLPEDIISKMMNNVLKAHNSREIQHFISDMFSIYCIQNL